jgi:hypothetical protein
MKGSHRSNRPYVRTSSPLASRRETTQVVERAGLARPSLEPLEPRQLLFSLVITPESGGTVTGFFGYAIPYLFWPDEIDDAEVQDPIIEDFNDEDIGPVPSGTVFDGSNVRLDFTGFTPARMRIIDNQPNEDGEPTPGELALRAQPQAGEVMRFRFASGAAGVFLGVTDFTFDVRPSTGSNVGLPIYDLQGNPIMTVELLFQGEVISSFSGAALEALNTTNVGNPGIGTFVLEPEFGANSPVFDEVRMTFEGANNDAFIMDDASYTLTQGRFAPMIDGRIFGAEVVFSGPIGASVEFLDLYGRQMLQTIALGVPQGLQNVALIDLNDDGVPEGNDGIGQIIFRDTDATARFSIVGGTITAGDPEPDSVFTQGGFVFTRMPSLTGLFDAFEAAGFGFFPSTDDGDEIEIVGLPPGSGSVIIGAPYVRDNTNAGTYNPLGFADPDGLVDNPDQFNNSLQGIKVFDGANMGTVNVHAVLFGSSQFSGFVNDVWVGYLLGSISVDGDLGSLVVATDAGLWVPDPEADNPDIILDAITVSGAELLVGRTVGEIAIAGRSVLNVTVGGDLNHPGDHPPRDILRYSERELPAGISFDADVEDVIAAFAGGGVTQRYALFTPVFGAGTFRNDSILSAEFVSNTATAVEIIGNVGFGDPVNTFEDRADVFAFVADGSQMISIESSLLAGMQIRVVDQDGRTLGAQELTDEDLADFVRLNFTPDMPGVYYLVVQGADGATTDDDAGTFQSYLVTITGMAPVGFGSYRTGANSGATSDSEDVNSVSLISGAMGSVRVGTAWRGSGGAEVAPSTIFNTEEEDIDNLMDFRGGTFNIGGTLYNITTGSDFGEANFFEPINFFISGNLGTIVTGLSPVTGQGPFEGDLGVVNIQVGGSIAMLDIRGGIGVLQDVDDPVTQLTILEDDSTNIQVGLDPTGPVEIGMIRVGSRVNGLALNITAPAGTLVGGFLVDQDSGIDPTEQNNTGILFAAPTILTGPGSDVRFVNFNQIDGVAVDETTPFALGSPKVLSDDGGGQVQISLAGGDGNANSFMRLLPINESEGVAIAEIVVDLTGGGRLDIISLGSPNNTDVISIGKIIIIGASGAASIVIDGPVQIDVWLIEQTGGAALTGIANRTQNGDIVAIDVIGLTNLDIVDGNLGRTQLPTWGPRLIGPFMGIGQGAGGAVGGVLGIGGFIEPNWDGETYRPINDVDPGNVYLDDIGSPIDPYLNGIVVRTGDLTNVRVGEAIGDVIVAQGNLINVTANFDDITPIGEFHGIVGTLYADSISIVDIGDGLAARTQSPLSSTGIFANTDISRVSNPGNPGAFISSTILAGAGDEDNNAIGTDIDPNVFGLGDITLIDGSFVNAYIASQALDDFWTSFYIPGSDGSIFAGSIRELSTENGDFFRSSLVVSFLPLFELDNGFFDSSTIQVAGDATLIDSTGYRNSTLTGGDLEFRFNRILIGEDLGVLRTTTDGAPGIDDVVGIGDIIDLTVDVLGSVTGRIEAINITRADLDVDNNIALLMATGNIRGSSTTAGRLQMVTADNIRTSTFSISGPIIDILAGEITNTRIGVTGPDGRIETIETTGLLSGEISASGPITTIRSTGGDIVARIVTTTDEGDVMLLSAARDLDIETDISGTLDQLVAGRHIGNRSDPSVILVRDDVSTVDAGGQLYSDLRIGGGLTGTVSIGPVSGKPNNDQVGSGDIIAFERINMVDVVGDFGGSVVSFSGGIGTVRIVDGSFRQGGLIAAYDGTISLVRIERGHLLGDIHADVDIDTIFVLASDDGVFGDIGINPNLSTGVAFDALRNQLPPGAIPGPDYQGPTITSGEQIRSITTTNGSIFEATIVAGTFFATLSINGNVTIDNQSQGIGTVIGAGNKLNDIFITGNVNNTMFMSGVTYFGADGRPGGLGANADQIKRGFIRNVQIGGNANNVVFTAGIKAGADGVYNTGDDLVEFGKSRINTIQVGGIVNNVSAFSDAFVNSGNNITNGIQRSGTQRPVDDPQIAPGIPVGDAIIPLNGTPFNFSYAGGSGTITFTDTGASPLTNAYWDAGTGTITLIKTSKFAELIVNSDSGPFNSLDIVTNDDASVGTIRVNANLTGDSDIIIDNKLRFLQLQNFGGGGTIRAGGDILNISMGNFFGGNLAAHYVRNMTINGDFGSFQKSGEARMDLISAENITVTGGFFADMNVSRYIGLFQTGKFQVNGLMRRGVLRVGESAGPVTIGEMVESRISVNDRIASVTINGHMDDSAIIAGGDLGEDAAFGGTGINSDRTTTGHIGAINVHGDFIESDIVAGLLRGPDGYFGTGDDSIADGRSTIGMITIDGDAAGSNLGSEAFRIAATGGVAGVTASGGAFFGIGNLDVDLLDSQPLPIEVVELRVTQDSFVYTAELHFNQNMNASTIGAALSVSEVRGNGQVTITLDEGSDYVIEYDNDDFIARIIFSQQVTEADLPQVGDKPGPGVYRFTLDPNVLRAQLVNARLDGDGDGFADPDDAFSQDDIVGDAGDKLVAETVVTNDESDNEISIDFYGATNLDNVMDDNFVFDGLADANTEFTLRGFLGDHPDADLDAFSFSSDVDIYEITLQEGQILRLGAMSGGAQFAARGILNSDGQALMATTRLNFDVLNFFGDPGPFFDLPIAQLASDTLAQRGTITPELIRLPNNPLAPGELTTEDTFLVRETGTYYLVVTNTDQFEAGNVPNISSVPGGTGAYAFDIFIFDDGDNGFSGNTDAGNGTLVINAPPPSDFAGPDGTFGTGDDANTISFNGYVFTLNPGADGLKGTADDIVSGGNAKGITSTNVGNTLTSTIQSSIGDPNAAGVPSNVQADLDIYHLNGRGLIDPGTKMRITVRLTDLGADLGSRTQESLLDFSGNVQFALFDTSKSNGPDDAVVVFSPTDFAPSGQAPGVLANDGTTVYGYDDNGDFFIEFRTPGQIGEPGLKPATYAVYLQGVFNTDYEIEIVTMGKGQVVKSSQNVLIELNGGTIDWLQAGGLTTQLQSYTTSVVGFTGKVDFQDVDDLIIDIMLDNLEAMFAAAGVDVNISTNPADFEFEDFSTVFLTRSNDPINFFSAQFYGASEHADVLNADHNDEAVVYVPTLGVLGLTPGEPGVEQFADSLTAAVGRRIGELLGLRTEAATFGGQTVNVMASNSPEVFGTNLSYRFSTVDQELSDGYNSLTDTIFFFGRQNASSLLDRILSE